MKKFLLIYVLSFFFISADLVKYSAPPPPDATTKIKSTFLYNFTKYIEWPASYKQGSFIIAIVGNYTLYNDVSAFFVGKKLGSQDYEIKYFATASDINTKCHIIFVPNDYTGSMSDVVSKAKGKSTLIITDKPGGAKQGAGINFVSIDNKQKFELNKTVVEKYDLKVSSSLVNLAIMIE